MLFRLIALISAACVAYLVLYNLPKPNSESHEDWDALRFLIVRVSAIIGLMWCCAPHVVRHLGIADVTLPLWSAPLVGCGGIATVGLFFGLRWLYKKFRGVRD